MQLSDAASDDAVGADRGLQRPADELPDRTLLMCDRVLPDIEDLVSVELAVDTALRADGRIIAVGQRRPARDVQVVQGKERDQVAIVHVAVEMQPVERVDDLGSDRSPISRRGSYRYSLAIRTDHLYLYGTN